jgi:hypothetical protein
MGDAASLTATFGAAPCASPATADDKDAAAEPERPPTMKSLREME